MDLAFCIMDLDCRINLPCLGFFPASGLPSSSHTQPHTSAPVLCFLFFPPPDQTLSRFRASFPDNDGSSTYACSLRLILISEHRSPTCKFWPLFVWYELTGVNHVESFWTKEKVSAKPSAVSWSNSFPFSLNFNQRAQAEKAGVKQKNMSERYKLSYVSCWGTVWEATLRHRLDSDSKIIDESQLSQLSHSETRHVEISRRSQI